MSATRLRHAPEGCLRSEGSFRRAARRLWISLAAAVVLSTAGAGAAQAAERWRPYPTVGVLERVTLRVRWFEDIVELRKAAKDTGLKIDESGFLHGLSVLRRNTETGEYVCEVFVLELKGAPLDAMRTMSFGHEVLHCFGLVHD